MKSLLPGSLGFVVSVFVVFLGCVSSDDVIMDFSVCKSWREPDLNKHFSASDLLSGGYFNKTITKKERFRFTCSPTGEKNRYGRLYGCKRDPYSGAKQTEKKGAWLDGFRAPAMFMSYNEENNDYFWRIDCDLSDKTCESREVYTQERELSIIHCVGKYK